MKKILVPTDFSDCARAAESVGIEVAKKANAEIHFLHILSTPVDWVKLPLEKEKLYPETKAEIGNASNELDKLKKKAEKQGLKAKQFLVFNKGREEIEEHIKNHQHDFIIMGSHGAKGVKEIIGSNTQKVARYSNVPILVVKTKPKNFQIKNIVFASSFEEEVQKPFDKILDFVKLMDAHIHLVYVNMPYDFRETDEIESKIQPFLKKCPKEKCTFNIYNALNEERGIKKFAKASKADMIALTTHGKTGFLKLISPSIAENLVNHTQEPILCINIKSK